GRALPIVVAVRRPWDFRRWIPQPLCGDRRVHHDHRDKNEPEAFHGISSLSTPQLACVGPGGHVVPIGIGPYFRRGPTLIASTQANRRVVYRSLVSGFAERLCKQPTQASSEGKTALCPTGTDY